MGHLHHVVVWVAHVVFLFGAVVGKQLSEEVLCLLVVHLLEVEHPLLIHFAAPPFGRELAPSAPSARTGSTARLAPLGRCGCYFPRAHFLLPPGAPSRPLAKRLGTLLCRTTWISFAYDGSRFLYT